MKEQVLAADKATLDGAESRRTAASLAMPRIKPRSLSIALAYRAKRLGQRIFGPTRMLRFCLNASWLLRRFAFELSSETFGDSFQCTAMALSEEVLREWIPVDGSVIDIGCGTGRWSRIAARYARSVVGIDYNAANIEIARRDSLPPNLEYLVGDITDQISHRQFDGALLIHVLEHIDDADDILETIRGMAPILLVEVPDVEADCLNLVRRELGCPYYSDGDHVREYTVAGLQQQLERNGWSIKYLRQHGGAILAIASRTTSQAVAGRVRLDSD